MIIMSVMNVPRGESACCTFVQHATIAFVSDLGLLRRPPEAGTESVVDLVDYAVRQGKVRIPEFQRTLKWTSEDVLSFFDSIYRGLPVGSLLFWKRPGDARPVQLGPLRVNATEMKDAWWVVDGQQRLVSLVAGLARPLPLPAKPEPSDPFVVYFDPQATQFKAPPRRGEVPSEWVPLPVLLDATVLAEWIHKWPHSKEEQLRRNVFEAGSRIREYKLPRYLVDAPDDEAGSDLLREIFFRVNKFGKVLSWDEVHDALYGRKGGVPSTTRELSDELAELGMGRPDEGQVATCLLALRGLDVTRPLAEHHRKDPRVLEGAIADALPALRQALAFLRKRGEIPHLRLLPRAMVLEVLTRFFGEHPEPSARTLELLVRWVWRVLVGEHTLDERTLERRTLAAVGTDEEDSIQAMLELLPRTAPTKIALPATFDARTAESRVAMLALASLAPRRFSDGELMDVSLLVEDHGADAFSPIIRSRGELAGVRGPENRVLHSAQGIREAIEGRTSSLGLPDPVLESHAITTSSMQALARSDEQGFLSERRARMEATLQSVAMRLAGWRRGDRDRPSIERLLRQTDSGA